MGKFDSQLGAEISYVFWRQHTQQPDSTGHDCAGWIWSAWQRGNASSAFILISLSSCSPFCSLSLFFLNFIYLFLLYWLCWVFGAAWTSLHLQQAGATLRLWCSAFSLQRLLLLRSTGSRAHRLSSRSSLALEHRLSSRDTHGLSRYVACGIFPNQGLNLCLLYWQADSQPLNHWGSPSLSL